ncbi:hypothetical protein FVEG_01982 [Fusarium verticillioides 7600]|uniref:Uncharacterized protein n=1 Tax=Gibberella moniliformis (strain M3125 / FGSC 7600) TaxID=334819 RepID=W7LKB2_GIBM7|nr:hypothetical protein FVEG_01982 [Fusarium verticillioides 7600]EWG38916.1 hypothetical protein FVEG_01982 [Fusarium verticillioides 7600]
MTQRVADIDDWVRMPYLISTTQNQFFENFPERAFRTRRALNRPDVCWETTSLRSLSDWSCDPGAPCCTCDCDCQPALRVNAQLVGYFCKPQDDTNVLDGTHSQSHGVGQALPGPFYAHYQPNTYYSYMGEPRVFYGEQEASSVEDMIYYRAKEQRHKNDAERRIQDWTRLMPELVGNTNASSSTHRMSKRCARNNNKEDKNQSARTDKKKEKNKGDGSKRKRRTFTRRSY